MLVTENHQKKKTIYNNKRSRRKITVTDETKILKAYLIRGIEEDKYELLWQGSKSQIFLHDHSEKYKQNTYDFNKTFPSNEMKDEEEKTNTFTIRWRERKRKWTPLQMKWVYENKDSYYRLKLWFQLKCETLTWSQACTHHSLLNGREPIFNTC